jgi:protein-S-isoprenylcysteine O-methyltransferase Ste14
MTGVGQMLLVLGFILVFGYFTAAGANTFERDVSDVKGATWGQFSLLVTGAIGAAAVSYRQPLAAGNGTVAAIALLCSVSLYEWARWTIRDRNFHIAFSGAVPEAVCDGGPYAYVRHPVYLSYMLAFIALAIAFPSLPAMAVLFFNAGLYVHAARDDERSLAESDLGQAYSAYRTRAGMFLPRLRRRAGGQDGMP